ncbi:hypothetical protein LR48_Vigan05g177100 [Vigna angularis]|uniref:Transposase Tnp1/En/Spm-like domain-containing protein n=1 Tax=Phaseolus angularis TaxID=3914 RepID=A0A0L9UN78_PHAAN|nr:hypothetical protein LR48_Vigan05g177100 [Vigna angularis]
MPKVKRFRNLQKSSPQPESLGTLPSTNAATVTSPVIEDQSPSTNPTVVASPVIEDQSPSTNPTMSESIEVQPHVLISPSPTNETSSHDSLNSTPSMPTENIEQPTTSKKHVGRESSSFWIVDAIDLEGVIKKIKVKVREVSNLPNGQRIIVEFDEVGMAIGEGQGVLAGFCGTLATDDNLFPINFERWSGKTGMPNTYFLECFKEVLQEICKKNRENRKKQVIPHTGGSKPISRRRHEMLLDSGELPSRGMLYIETHKRKDGSFVNDEAKAIAEQIEVGLSQSSADESQISPHDVVGRVLGPEHSGRVRCMGLGAAPTNSFRNTRMRLSDLSIGSSGTTTSSTSSNKWEQKYMNLESQVQTTLGALKAYMIMKEGKIPDELATFFNPQPQQARDDTNEPESPLGTRQSSDGSNI